MKNCPHCDGEIRDSVIRCNHCGQDVKAPVGSVPQPTAIPTTAPVEPEVIAPGVPAPQVPASAQFTPAVAPMPAGPPPAASPGVAPGMPTPPAGDQPQYFAMKTDLSPAGGLQPGYGATSSSHGDPAKSALIAGVLGLLGAVIAGVGLFKMALLTATASGTIDMGAANGGPQQVPFTQTDLKLGDWDGLVKTLLMISIVGAAVFAIMLITNPNTKAAGRLLGQGIVMTAMSAWLFTLLSGFKEDLMTAYNILLDAISSQIPADQYETFRAQAEALVTIKTGVGFWMIVVGSLVVLGGSIVGALAMKGAQPSSKF